MKVDATTKVRYFDTFNGGMSGGGEGVLIETSLSIIEDSPPYTAQGSKVPMTLIERAQDKLRQTVVASMVEAQKNDPAVKTLQDRVDALEQRGA